MTLSKLKLLGALTIIGGFAWGGAARGRATGGRRGTAQARGCRAADGNRRSGLPSDRSVESIENELDNAARHISEMQKSITSLREELAARRGRQEPSVAARTAIRLADALKADPVRAVKRLANALIQHAPRFDGFSPHATQIYLMDVASGDLTLIVAEPAREFPLCGMPTWSQDGGRILFEAAREDSWPRTLSRLFAVEDRRGASGLHGPRPGQQPDPLPGRQVDRVLAASEPELGADTGVWLMRSDGSERRRVGEFDPYWSPNGKEFLINSCSPPTESTVLNLETKEASVIHVAEHQIFSWPSWVGPGTMVAVLSPKEKYEGDTIAVIDVRNPAEAKIIEVLEAIRGLRRHPAIAGLSAGRASAFTGEVRNKRGLYTVRRGDPRGARSTGWCVENLPNTYLASPCFSPDGRYLLFHAYGPVVKEIAVLDR